MGRGRKCLGSLTIPQPMILPRNGGESQGGSEGKGERGKGKGERGKAKGERRKGKGERGKAKSRICFFVSPSPHTPSASLRLGRIAVWVRRDGKHRVGWAEVPARSPQPIAHLRPPVLESSLEFWFL